MAVLTIDELLQTYLGELGRAQWLVILVGSYVYMQTSILMFLMSFTFINPLYNNVAGFQCIHAADKHGFGAIVPGLSACTTAADAIGAGSQDLAALCSIPQDDWSWQHPSVSIISQFSLVCERDWLLAFAEAGFFIGFLIGNGVLGTMTDRLGRKRVLWWCAIACTLTTFLGGIAPNYPTYFIARALSGTAGAGQSLAGFVYVGEMVGPSKRGFAGMCVQLSFTVGEILLVLLALATRASWRTCSIAVATVNGIILLLITLIPESPRYLLVCGQKDRAMQALNWIGRLNGRPPLPADIAEQLGVKNDPSSNCHSPADDVEALTSSANRMLKDGMKAGLSTERPTALSAADSASHKHTDKHTVVVASPKLQSSMSLATLAPAEFGNRDTEQQPLLQPYQEQGPLMQPAVRRISSSDAQLHLLREQQGHSWDGVSGSGVSDLLYSVATGASVASTEGRHHSTGVCVGAEEQACHSRSGSHPATSLYAVHIAASTEAVTAGLVPATYNSEGGDRAGKAGVAASNYAEGPAVTGVGGSGVAEGGANEESLLHAIKHPITRKYLLSTCYMLFSLSAAYFGVTLALGELSGSFYFNFALLAAAELPAVIAVIFSVERVGRKIILFTGTMVAGVSCLLCSIAPGGAAQLMFAMAGKFGCSAAWAMGITYSGELFPTTLRSAAVGVSSQSGDVGGLVAPLLLLLARRMGLDPLRVPFAVMGIAASAGALVIAQLPETRGMPQMDTLSEFTAYIMHDHEERKAHSAASGGLVNTLRRRLGLGLSSSHAAGRSRHDAPARA